MEEAPEVAVAQGLVGDFEILHLVGRREIAAQQHRQQEGEHQRRPEEEGIYEAWLFFHIIRFLV